ncbi:Piwi domain-containing protein [Syncephalis pseudoplumigaleata]|uniref:Piwi domain-containing protein n=1 Tax=Syncephalis pseudoplumigaleata TaxID=1712513 RepID=A0A4V1J1D8_9FUNG|nr:Piwi domain-containing protein [Syncephalis pseudoplumigaleata]|eukprot:RKP24709.1 Piwi domain-containing protein [Syncephalis pseudoplumigaleata]
MSQQLLRRPAYGTAGKPVEVLANHYALTALPRGNLIHLDVKITTDKEVKEQETKRQIIAQLQAVHKNKLGKATLAYDGMATAFSPHPMAAGSVLSVEVMHEDDIHGLINNNDDDVTMPDAGDGGASGKRKPRIFKVMLRQVGVVNMETVQAFYSGKLRDPEALLLPTMALEVMLRHMMASRFLSIGRSIYTGEDCRGLPNGLDAWRGYTMSVRPGESNLMLNINATTSAFYRPGPLVDFVREFVEARDYADIPHRLRRTLKRVRVHVTHRKDFKPRLTITDLSSKPAREATFNVGDSKKIITVEEYFAKQYGYRLRHPMLPCVVDTKGSLFPMELCVIEPNQRVRHQLNEAQLAEMIKYAAEKPHQRRNRINDCHHLVEFNRDSTLKQFGVRVDNRMVSIPARQLASPNILYHPSLGRHAMVEPRDGTWSLQGKRLLVPATIGSWAIIVFGSKERIPESKVKDYFVFMANQFMEKGINVVGKNPPVCYGHGQSDAEKALQQAIALAKTKFRAPPQIIFTIFTGTTDLYGSIKRIAETKLGILTQGMRSPHLFRPNAQYCGNMSLKVNKKLGGTNSKLVDRSIPVITSEPTIVMGADVSHPTGQQSRKQSEWPSIAAVCGSMDALLSSYDSTYRPQESCTEIIEKLGEMTKEILINFRRKSGHEPRRIIFYRDGVSDGEFQHVLDAEVRAIKQACRELSANYNPKLTFIVAKKRHHTRLFAAQGGPQATDRSGNCKPGTVVDRVISSPGLYDFFLQAHAGIQGTCNPVHYVVLYDENKMSPDTVQEMTNRMSYTFSRCSRSVSLVPAVYWAHLMADRARHYLKSKYDIGAAIGSLSLHIHARMRQ